MNEVEFYKSSFSSSNNGCVEVGFDGPWVYVRDSKDQGGPVHKYTRAEWTAFLAGAKANEFELPT